MSAPDRDRLLATVEALQAMDRPPASAGERAAAEWIRDALAAEGAAARLEEEPATGSFPVPVALLAAIGAAAGLSRRGRVVPGLAGVAAAAGIADDVSGGAHWFRRAALPRKVTTNVIGELGDPDARETVIFVAHHDAANAGLIFHPGPTRLVADAFPDWYGRQETSPPLMQLVVAGPLLAGAGALLGRRRLRRAGGAAALLAALVVGEIAARRVVPGANDNLAAVAVLLELARALRAEPVADVRVILLSTGAEESFMEGMRGFVARHRAALDPARTRVVVLECVGGPEPIVLEGEGMLRMRDYTPATRDWLAAAGERAGHPLRRRLRSGFATDALISLKAGLPTAVLASIDEYKMAANYHSRNDVAANLDLGTVAACVEVCAAAVRSLSLGGRPAPVPA
jgi:acetylornithine deacetylase/succinyl-diaminopimelate desuccinylase-like protein